MKAPNVVVRLLNGGDYFGADLTARMGEIVRRRFEIVGGIVRRIKLAREVDQCVVAVLSHTVDHALRCGEQTRNILFRAAHQDGALGGGKLSKFANLNQNSLVLSIMQGIVL